MVNHIESCGCPKIMKQILLGSQNCVVSVTVFSSCMYLLIPGAIKSFEMFNIVRINIIGIFVVKLVIALVLKFL